MFKAEGSIGIFFWGIVLGWFFMFFIKRNGKDAKGIALILAAIGGTTFLTWLSNNVLLDEYGLGIAVGFFANIIVRIAGKTIGGKTGDGMVGATVYK